MKKNVNLRLVKFIQIWYTLCVINMKDKKRVQTILLILIGVIAIILAIVLIFGGLKDKKVKKHLEEMCDKTRHLSYNDISLLKKHNKDGKGITKKENIQIKDDQQKEIQ